NGTHPAFLILNRQSVRLRRLMHTNKRSTFILPSLMLLLLLGSAVPSAAQETKSGASSPVAEPVKRESNEEVEQLKTQLKQLQLLVEQQQQALSEIRKRLDETSAKPTTAQAVAVDASVKVATQPTSVAIENSQSATASNAKSQSTPDKPAAT